jgi:hypothetical protein
MVRASGQLKDIAPIQTPVDAAMIVSLASNFALKGCAVALRVREAHVNLPHVSVSKICGITSTTESAMGESKSLQLNVTAGVADP